MEQGPASRNQTWLIVFLLGLAAVLGFIILMLLRDRTPGEQERLGEDARLASTAAASTQIQPLSTTTPELSTMSAAQTAPTPTFVPLDAPAPNAPSEPPTQSAPEVQPTAHAQPTTPPVPVQGQGVTVQLDDNVWGGGFRSSRGYGGRSATWIYGTGTDYSSMQATLILADQPPGAATLTIEGMDSEDRSKTPIQILVNGSEIWNGPNPLPNDDLPLESGTWASQAFQFDGALLRQGENTIQINNLKPGVFSRPPFFMLDYATITLQAAGSAVQRR